MDGSIFPNRKEHSMPKINGNEIRPGNVLEHDGGLWAAVKVSHVKPGKGGAFAQVELKNLRDGRKLNERFRSEDKVEQVRLEQKDQQFLYESDGKLVFMDSETFEQIGLSNEVLGDAVPYLIPNIKLKIELWEGRPVGIELPLTVDLKVVETEPAIKGASVSNQNKPAKMETGLVVNVPPFISEGDVIRIDTATGGYIERARS